MSLEVPVEALCAEVAAFMAQLPEPPLYRRKKDPAFEVAAARAKAGEALKAKLEAREEPSLIPYRRALEAHLAALTDLAAHRVESAEPKWRVAVKLEREALRSRRAWAEGAAPPVFVRESGQSRYDPKSAARAEVMLICPFVDCRRQSKFSFAPNRALHSFSCVCGRTFDAYFAELRRLDAQGDLRQKRVRAQVRPLGGGDFRIDFNDHSGGSWAAAPHDTLAFLYTPDRALRGVLNLSSSRVLWVAMQGGCFLATAAFGDGAHELRAFRHFRDRVLLPRGAGRFAVRAYYRLGPKAAGWVLRRPAALRGLKKALRCVYEVLSRSGFESDPSG